MSPKQFLDWLHQQPEWFREEIQKQIWTSRPDVIHTAVKALRRIVSDPSSSRKNRTDAEQLLRKTGFDEESLNKDDTLSEEIDDD